MMWAYILKLLILIPLVGGLAYGSLWLWRRVQPGMARAVSLWTARVALADRDLRPLAAE